jgi:hypothetical protein
MEVDEKTKVGYSEQFQVQNLDPQVTEEVLDELLGRTLQYQTMKGNYEMDSMVQPRWLPLNSKKGKEKNSLGL